MKWELILDMGIILIRYKNVIMCCYSALLGSTMATTGLLSSDHHDLCSLFNQVLIKMMIMVLKIIVFMHEKALLQYFWAIFCIACWRYGKFIPKYYMKNYVISDSLKFEL